jgi:hypothetical protein
MSRIQNLPQIPAVRVSDDDLIEILDPQQGTSYSMPLVQLRAAVGGGGGASLVPNFPVDDPTLAQPYAALTSWQPNTLYADGFCVRGIGTGNTTNMYVCVLGGTSAAATGPVGAGSAGISDNTVRWLYFGTDTATSTIPLFSSAAPTTATDVMDGYLSTPLFANVAALGLTFFFRFSTTTAYPGRFTGGVFPFDLGGGNLGVKPSNGGTLAAPVFFASQTRYCVHLQTDCRKWLGIRPVPNVSTAPFVLEVNGRPLSSGNTSAIASVVGGIYMLDLGKFGPGVKDIKLYARQSLREIIFEVYLGADENIWTPSTASNLRLGIEGDSLTSAAGIGPRLVGNYFGTLLAKKLGIDNWFDNSQGGTGAIADKSGTGTTYIQRIAELAEFAPDIVVVNGFYNDGSFSEAARQAAFLAYFQALRAALPNALIFVAGSGTLQGDNIAPASPRFDTENDTISVLNALGDANIVFIPMLTGFPVFPRTTSNGWFFQSGAAAPFNDGHPVPRYYPSAAEKVAVAIRAYFASRT